MITVDGYIFEGHYAKLCSDFIKYKRSIGYKYGARVVRRVRNINEYLSSSAMDRDDGDYSLNKETVSVYTARRGAENARTQQQREIIVRQFAIFLNSLSISVYIAPVMKKDNSTFTPYIFTREQIMAILNVTDHLEYEYRSPHYHHVYPFLIRLLYCCGLRISEALALRIENIDFAENVLRIEQAKYNNSRLVPMSGSLCQALEKYMNQIGCRKTDRGLLFGTRRNAPYRANSILSRFKDFLQKAGIPCTENGGMPRLHDVRHTFAVHALDRMAAQGMDTYCAIPYLAAYMGHRKIWCTEQYLRLTPAAYGGIVDALSPLYENLFPKEVAQNEKS